MREIIPAASRGVADHGWLKSRFSFSFAGYYNPARIQFGALRVLNDDVIQSGSGFGMHPHDNMEIISIPLFGALEHRDNMGNGSVIRPGEVQLMHAGTGVRHSEFNPADEDGGFLQIWIFPEHRNTKPGYAQKAFDPEYFEQKWGIVASPNSENESLEIGQQAWLSLGRFAPGQNISYKLQRDDNGCYLFVIEGSVRADMNVLQQRDALAVSNEHELHLEIISDAYLLMIEVPMQ